MTDPLLPFRPRPHRAWAMSYRLDFFVRSMLIQTEYFSSRAIRDAQRWAAREMDKGGFDCAELHDDAGQLVFRYEHPERTVWSKTQRNQ